MIINSYIFLSYDADAQAYFTAANITNSTEKTAVNDLVVDLKAYGIWSKCIAIYPYRGSAASSTKFNLKNPLDTNAAYRISWSGGVTHNYTGVTGNGSNGFGETWIQPSTNLSLNNSHISFYSRTNSQNANAEMGVSDGTLNASIRIIARNVGNNLTYNINDNTGGVVGSQTDSRGFYLVSRLASNNRRMYKNGALLVSATTASVTLTTATIPVLGQKAANNIMNAYLAKTHSFASVGQGLNDSEVANFNTALNKFFTTLGI